MTAYKHNGIDYWGDENQGEHFTEMVDHVFGNHRGARKTAMNVLNLGRRILNMYMTGQRRIPDDVWQKVKHLYDNDIDPTAVWDDGVDPLS